MSANEVDKLMYEYDCMTMSAAIGPAAGGAENAGPENRYPLIPLHYLILLWQLDYSCSVSRASRRLSSNLGMCYARYNEESFFRFSDK